MVESTPTRIIFADHDDRALGETQKVPNLNLLYAASYVRERFPGADVAYISQKHAIEHHVRLVKEMYPDFYVISLTAASAQQAYAVITLLKHQFPWLRVVVVGPHATSCPEEPLHRAGADISVIGEAEITCADLIEARQVLFDTLPRIDGIGFLQDGGYVQTPSRAAIGDVNAIPLPAWDLVNQAEFKGLTHSKAHPSTEMLIARGCPYQCVYCAHPVYKLKHGGPLYRARSPRSIAAEAEDLYQRGYREISLRSDDLNVKLEWAIDVCKALTALNHPDLFFQTNLRANPLSEELAMWMARANFWLVRLGIEPDADAAAQEAGRGTSHAQTERACQVLSSHGMRVVGLSSVFRGWDQHDTVQESLAGVQDTIDMVYRLWREGTLHACDWQLAPPGASAQFDRRIDDERDGSGQARLAAAERSAFKALYAKARRQQALMVVTPGDAEWRNWKGNVVKAWSAFRDRPEPAFWPQHRRTV